MNGAEYLLRVNRVSLSRSVTTWPSLVVATLRSMPHAPRAVLERQVTVVYRRSRAEMPALAAEIEEAVAEGVEILLLSAPVRVEERGGSLVLTVIRMELGEPDGSGRRRPIAVPDSESELSVDGVIAAVSQEPAWSGLEELQQNGWLALIPRAP